jgi:hypothetical protein
MAKKQPTVLEIFARRNEIDALMKPLEEEREALTALLRTMIPEGSEIDHVKHSVSERRTVAWKDYAAHIIDKYVAQNRRGTASSDEEKFVNVTLTHTIKESKPK